MGFSVVRLKMRLNRVAPAACTSRASRRGTSAPIGSSSLPNCDGSRRDSDGPCAPSPAQFPLHDLHDFLHAGNPESRKPPTRDAPNANRLRAQGQRLENVGSAAESAVNQHRNPPSHGIHNLGEHFRRASAVAPRAATVVSTRRCRQCHAPCIFASAAVRIFWPAEAPSRRAKLLKGTPNGTRLPVSKSASFAFPGDAGLMMGSVGVSCR